MGIDYANVPPLIGNLCRRPDGSVDAALFAALMHGPLSLDDALDLDEIAQVSASAHDAAQVNLEAAT